MTDTQRGRRSFIRRPRRIAVNNPWGSCPCSLPSGVCIFRVRPRIGRNPPRPSTSDRIWPEIPMVEVQPPRAPIPAAPARGFGQLVLAGDLADLIDGLSRVARLFAHPSRSEQSHRIALRLYSVKRLRRGRSIHVGTPAFVLGDEFPLAAAPAHAVDVPGPIGIALRGADDVLLAEPEIVRLGAARAAAAVRQFVGGKRPAAFGAKPALPFQHLFPLPGGLYDVMFPVFLDWWLPARR